MIEKATVTQAILNEMRDNLKKVIVYGNKVEPPWTTTPLSMVHFEIATARDRPRSGQTDLQPLSLVNYLPPPPFSWSICSLTFSGDTVSVSAFFANQSASCCASRFKLSS